jgi:type II secretory pathway component GspD/PulD (secretin)
MPPPAPVNPFGTPRPTGKTRVTPATPAVGFGGSKAPAVGDLPLIGQIFRSNQHAVPSPTNGFGVTTAEAITYAPPSPSVQFEEEQSVVKMQGVLVSVRFDHLDIHAALKKFFDGIESSYMIKSNVEVDRVTCSLRNVTREKALETILAAVKQPLTYRVEEGVYTILPKAEGGQ